MGNLANLTTLGLYGNQLSGEIPAELGSLTFLEYLDLGRNQLSGEIPPELGSLTFLTALHLYGNRLSGCVPSGLQGQLDRDDTYLGVLPVLPGSRCVHGYASAGANLVRKKSAGRHLPCHRRPKLEEQHKLAERRAVGRMAPCLH